MVNESGNSRLRIFSDSSYRGAAFAVDPLSLGEAGTYQLSFDTFNFSGDALDQGIVSIWAGSGYTIGSGPGALIVDTLTHQLAPLGGATATQLGSDFTITGALTNQTIDFAYDGSSTLVFFFGVQTQGFPHPSIDYDNISISVSPIPEPRTWALLAGLAALAFTQVKRRR